MFQRTLKYCAAALAVCCAVQLTGAVRVTPINEAEAVFSVFWDHSHQESRKWKVQGGKLYHGHGALSFLWERKSLKKGVPAISFTKKATFDVGDYTYAIFCCCIPVGAKLKVILETDKGIRTGEWVGVRSLRDEYLLELEGAKKIHKVTFQVFDTGKNKLCRGFLQWFGLGNKEKLQSMFARYKAIGSQKLDRFLAPGKPKPSFTGTINMLLPAQTLAKLQKEYALRKQKTGEDPLRIQVDPSYNPMENYAGMVCFANPSYLGRVRDQSLRYKYNIRTLISRGLLCKDPEMLAMAAKIAVVFALIPQWDSFLSYFMDAGWDQRVFSHATIAEQLALALDYCGSFFSAAGRELICKRLAVEGLGQINYNVWRYAYLFGNNQLAVFTRGRVPAYLALEKAYAWHGKKVVPYTELAMKEMFESMSKLIHHDGSFLEGPPYFGYTISGIQPVLEMYANARGKDLKSIVPSYMKNLGNFADTFVSTDRRGGMIPISSGQGNGRGVNPSVVQFLARIAPDSQWVNLYHAEYERRGEGMLSDLSIRAYHDAVPRKKNALKPLATLPVMGVMASHRYYRGKVIKILFNGTKAMTRCHRHNDRGSFVLEFAGDTFAADSGGQRYADADASMVIRSDYHNMLVPVNPLDNEPTAVAKADVYPAGKGDKVAFHASMEAAPSSYYYFTKWNRTIDSPTPDVVNIRDTYTLKAPYDAAKFVWITQLPHKILPGNKVRLDGKESFCIITVPSGMTIRAEVLKVRQKEKYTRLSFAKKGKNSSMQIQVRFYLKKK